MKFNLNYLGAFWEVSLNKIRERETKLQNSFFFFLFSKFFFYCLYLWNKFSHFSRRFGYQCHRRIRPQDLGEEEQEAFGLVINLIWFLKIHNWYQLSLTMLWWVTSIRKHFFFLCTKTKLLPNFFWFLHLTTPLGKAPQSLLSPYTLHTSRVKQPTTEQWNFPPSLLLKKTAAL